MFGNEDVRKNYKCYQQKDIYIYIYNIYTSTYKFKRAFFRHDRRTAPKFGTHVRIQTRLALTKKNWPTPPQRGLGVIYWCLWVECLWVAWFKPVVDRKLLERLMSPSPKSQVMFESAFSWIGDFFEFLGLIFFKLWRVWCQPFATSLFARWHHSCPFATSRRCVYKESGSPSWTLDQPWHCYSGQRAAYASGPTLTDRRHDEQRGSPYDAKCNVAEIGAVNMGEIGAVRKRSR